MPTFRISVVNHAFEASNVREAASLDEASAQGIKSALAIGIQEVGHVVPYFFGAEVVVEQDQQVLRRFVVSVGASPLQ